MSMTITDLARAAITARERYGWSPETDNALNALRAALDQPVALELPDLESVAVMLDAYIVAIKESGEYERWHYIPEVQDQVERLRASASAAAVGEPISEKQRDSIEACIDMLKESVEKAVGHTAMLPASGAQLAYLCLEKMLRATPPSAQQEGGV